MYTIPQKKWTTNLQREVQRQRGGGGGGGNEENEHEKH